MMIETERRQRKKERRENERTGERADRQNR
jgi:hypothetical protein